MTSRTKIETQWSQFVMLTQTLVYIVKLINILQNFCYAKTYVLLMLFKN